MKIGDIVKTTDFNKKLFIQEKKIFRNNNSITFKFGNKNIFQKIINTLFIENNYKQGCKIQNFYSFSVITSSNKPAVFSFWIPDFLENTKCKINIIINSAIFFSKITFKNITKTISTLSDTTQSNSNDNSVIVSDFYSPPITTSQNWQGEGFSDGVIPEINCNLFTSAYYDNEKANYGHVHLYNLVGESISNNVYHKHNFSLKSHNHEIILSGHKHFFSPHQHNVNKFSHNHLINLEHNHDLSNSIYTSSIGKIRNIVLDDENYINKSEINISSNKHILKVFIDGDISKIQCNIEVTGNYI